MQQTQEDQPKTTPVKWQSLGALALGIVTRMGRNPQGFGGVAIEPGPEGHRPEICNGCTYACRADQAGCVDRFQDLIASKVIDGKTQASEEASAGDATGRACATRRGARAVPLGNTGTTTGKGAAS